MNIARVLGAVAMFAAVAIGIASPVWAGGPTTPTSPTVTAPGRSRRRIERHLHLHCRVRKHHYVDDHTVWHRMRHGRSYEFVGWERALHRASAVDWRSLEHDGRAARCPNVRRQQPRSGNDHIFMGRSNTRRHSVQPRGPRYVWQHRPRRFPRSYFRVHIDESRLSESSCRRPADRAGPGRAHDLVVVLFACLGPASILIAWAGADGVLIACARAAGSRIGCADAEAVRIACAYVDTLGVLPKAGR